jgi:hypothetical protein
MAWGDTIGWRSLSVLPSICDTVNGAGFSSANSGDDVGTLAGGKDNSVGNGVAEPPDGKDGGILVSLWNDLALGIRSIESSMKNIDNHP